MESASDVGGRRGECKGAGAGGNREHRQGHACKSTNGTHFDFFLDLFVGD